MLEVLRYNGQYYLPWAWGSFKWDDWFRRNKIEDPTLSKYMELLKADPDEFGRRMDLFYLDNQDAEDEDTPEDCVAIITDVEVVSLTKVRIAFVKSGDEEFVW